MTIDDILLSYMLRDLSLYIVHSVSYVDEDRERAAIYPAEILSNGLSATEGNSADEQWKSSNMKHNIKYKYIFAIQHPHAHASPKAMNSFESAGVYSLLIWL